MCMYKQNTIILKGVYTLLYEYYASLSINSDSDKETFNFLRNCEFMKITEERDHHIGLGKIAILEVKDENGTTNQMLYNKTIEITKVLGLNSY